MLNSGLLNSKSVSLSATNEIKKHEPLGLAASYCTFDFTGHFAVKNLCASKNLKPNYHQFLSLIIEVRN